MPLDDKTLPGAQGPDGNGTEQTPGEGTTPTPETDAPRTAADKKKKTSTPKDLTTALRTGEIRAAAGRKAQEKKTARRGAPAGRRGAEKPPARTTGSISRAEMRELQRRSEALPPLPQVKRSKNPLLRAIGNMLYTLGFAAEYQVLRVLRVVRNVLLFAGQLLLWLFASVGRWIAGMVRGLWEDVTAPLRRYRRRRRQLHRIQERMKKRQGKVAKKHQRTLTGVGMKFGLQLVAAALAFLLPVASGAALVYTVYQVTGRNYALAVEHNGHLLGYVADQTVVDSAKSLLRQRIRLADGQELTDWQLTPTYTIAHTNQLTTTRELVNEILLSGSQPGDAVMATGLYIKGDLVGVTTEGQRLRQYLDGLLDEYRDPEYPDARVDFVETVVCEPDNDDVYFTDSIIAYDELIEDISRNVHEAEYFTADGELTLSEIAHESDITFEQLLARNPDYEGISENTVPAAGTRLLVQRAQPLLQVQSSVLRKSEEPIPYAVSYREDENYIEGSTLVEQRGVEGWQEVWDYYNYVDGELVGRTRVDEMTVVLVEPVEEIVRVGTRSRSEIEAGAHVNYIWPAPAATWSSRGIRLPGHRGLDVNGAAGIAILAAGDGVVASAGWHWSWGWNVVIDHNDGMSTRYAHLLSTPLVEQGAVVSAGTQIGTMGSTGTSTGTHLHLEFFTTGNQNDLYDPLGFVQPGENFEFRWG